MKEKVKNKILNILKIALLVLLFVIPIFTISLNSELIVGDEIWNFQNVLKMVKGNLMYVDCNIIVTPIFYLIGYVFVKLIGSSILGFRIYNILIFLTLLLSSFFLFKALKIDNKKSFIYTLILFLFIMPYISVGANYNVLAEAIFILGIVLFLNRENIKLYNLFQGLIIFSLLFTKQNIGAYYFIAIVIAEILLDKKNSIHYIVRELMVTLICMLVAVIIMNFTGCFKGFLNYTILGMGEFTTQNFKLQNEVKIVIIGYLTIAICSYILAFLVSRKNKDIRDNMKVLTVFSILLNLSILPIVNLYHTSFAILINVIIFVYLLDTLLLSKIKNKVFAIILAIVLYLVINSYGVICGYRASKNVRITDTNNVYFSSNVSEELNNKMNQISEYIKQKESENIDVISISSDSALYMTLLNKNHKELDLCFKGNLGYNGKEEVIEKIKLLKDTEIMINQNDYWQEIDELKKYVRENYEKIKTIGDIDIYKVTKAD